MRQRNIYINIDNQCIPYSGTKINYVFTIMSDNQWDAALTQRKTAFLTLIGKKTYHVFTNLLDPKTDS